MNMDHVPYSPRSVPGSSKRLTMRHFVTVSSSLVQNTARNNQDAQPPANRSTRLPPIILDGLCGNAVLIRWATQTTIDLIRSWTKENDYMQQARGQEVAETKATHIAKQMEDCLERAEERAKRAAGGRGEEEMSPGTCSMCCCFVLIYRHCCIHWNQICPLAVEVRGYQQKES